MNPAVPPAPAADTADSLLRADLAQVDRVHAAIGPVLRHLVASEDHAVFTEEIVARTRAMIESLAASLLRDRETIHPVEMAALARALFAQPSLLAHCHGLALEAQLTERLANSGFDPVLSPLLQAGMGTSDAESAALAMSVMAAQARFVQQQRRMAVAPSELPSDVLHEALIAAQAAGAAADAVDAFRSEYDEGRTRLALLSHFLFGLRDGLAASMDIGQAGAALFLSSVALATGFARSRVVLATAEGHQPQMALLLAAAGLGPGAVEAVLMQLHPDIAVSRHWLGISREHALALFDAERSRD